MRIKMSSIFYVERKQVFLYGGRIKFDVFLHGEKGWA